MKRNSQQFFGFVVYLHISSLTKAKKNMCQSDNKAQLTCNDTPKTFFGGKKGKKPTYTSIVPFTKWNLLTFVLFTSKILFLLLFQKTKEMFQ